MVRGRMGLLGFIGLLALLVAETPAFGQANDPNRKYGIGSEGRQGMLFLLLIADIKPYSGAGLSTIYNHPLAKMARGGSSPLRRPGVFQAPPAGDDGTLISVVGEFGFSRVNGANITTVMAGPRVTRPISPKSSVFGQMTAGLVNSYGSSDFGLQPGGGILYDTGNWIVSAHIDFLLTFYEGGSDKGTRIRGGVAIPLGGR